MKPLIQLGRSAYGVVSVAVLAGASDEEQAERVAIDSVCQSGQPLQVGYSSCS